ncbi:hypothetical protein CK203_093717 [Vitis vinifera]|uniref:DUF4283 domain-containing protein n=1 Tax=Vitis vinifera TaxID=29760 RepID=A0A438D1Z2_VITVI|nr:hypothetical protein CK203_093717 [Vitis vinifera]
MEVGMFLEGKGILGGWTLLAEKLRSLGVSTHDEPREVLVFSRTESRVGAHEGKAKNSYVDAVKTRARRLGEPVWLQLGEEDVLSGRKMLDWCLVGRWGESPVSAPDLSALGRWGKYHWNLKGVKFARLGGPFILIEFENKAEADKVLLRGFRCFKDLFLHLERGFVAVDENTATFKELQWARLLVKSKRVLEVILVIRNGLGKEQEVKDEEGGVSRAGYNVEHIQSHEQSAKVTVPCESGEDCCRKDREALFSDSMLAREAEAETVRGRLLSVWEGVSKNWPAAQVNSPLGRDLEMNVERRPNEEGLFDAALKNLLKGMSRCGLWETDGDVLGIQLGSSPPALNLTELTDEALMEEASKDTTSYPRALFLLGKWISLLLLFFLGGMGMILADGREAEVSGFSGMANEAVEEEIKDVSERAFQEVMEEGNEAEGKLDGRKKKKLESSKFERELRKLEWTVNYIGGGGEGGIVFSGLDEDLYAFLEWVYGPTMRRDRECFWDELGAIKGLWNGPWCVARDFNAILSPDECSRGGSLNSNMKRLDRFLVNEEWDCHFSGLRQCVLSRLVSDHFSILLEGGGLRRGLSPFRFENMWLKVESFKDLLRSWWEGDNFNGTESFILVEKLKVVKSKLKEWNIDVFGRVKYRKNLALDQMEF